MFKCLVLVLMLINLYQVYSLYNLTQANIGVYLSGAAYCGKEKYSSMKLTGPAEGFVVHGTLHDITTDLQGYTGYLDSTESIYVVFRGSTSLLNWLDDFEVRQVDYTTWPECECKVHNGFYRAALNLKNETLFQVQTLMKKKPTFQVYVTSHSLGSTVGDLIAMELKKHQINSIFYGYGKPRVGDSAYAKFVNSEIPNHYRHTHNKDIVPHVPPIEGFGYYHSCQEIFETETGELRFCSQTDCEDKTCGNQYRLSETNSQDHMYYLSHQVDCENSTL